MSKIDLGHRTPKEVRAWLGRLQWCIIIWYYYDDNTVSVTTCPSLKACLQEVYQDFKPNDKWDRERKKELVEFVVSGDEDKSFEYSGNNSCTIQILEDKYHFQYTAKELCYEVN